MRSSNRFVIACIATSLALIPTRDAAATTEVAAAIAALSFWMTWGVVYLAIGVALIAIATASAFGERRAWSSLLSLAGGDDDTDAADAGPDSSRRAA